VCGGCFNQFNGRAWYYIYNVPSLTRLVAVITFGPGWPACANQQASTIMQPVHQFMPQLLFVACTVLDWKLHGDCSYLLLYVLDKKGTENSVTQLQSVTCHMGTHSVTF